MAAAKGQLNVKQAAFVREYLIDLNATQAAIRAGYSAKTAGSLSFTLLQKVEIQVAIQAGMNKRAIRTEITQDRILTELAKLAFFDVRTLFNDDGSLKDVRDLDDDAAAAIAGIDVNEISSDDGKITITKKVKLLDRNSAIEKCMRHLGMFNDKQTLKHEFGALTDEEINAKIAKLSK